jgi:hypothetical protein
VQINNSLDGLSSRTSRRQRYAQDRGMAAMKRSLPIVIVGQPVKSLCKLNVPLGAFAVRQTFEHRVLQQREPFRVAVMLGYFEMLLAHIGNFVRRCIREDVVKVTSDRAALEVVGILFTIRASQQHISLEVGY